MHEKPFQAFLRSGLWAFSIVAVIFLAPSSGLITLTMPDEPYGNILNVPDVPHLGKRATDDSSHLVYDTAVTAYRIHHSFLSESSPVVAAIVDPHTIRSPLNQIRGPPKASPILIA